VRISAGDSEATPAQMTRDKAYAILGIADNKEIKFDNILSLKNKLLDLNAGDREKLLEVCKVGFISLWVAVV
jgi:hypothetical protein